MKIILTISSFLFSLSLAFRQMEKTIHQTFKLQDVQTISLDLFGEYIIVPWAGNTVMSETRVEIFDASPSILEHFVEKEQRYFIKADTSGNTMKLTSADKKRETIRTKNGSCTEKVQLKVYIPDEYLAQNETTFVLKKQE